MTLATSGQPRKRIEALEAAIGELRSHNVQLTAERARYRELYLQMHELNKKLERGLLGQKAERLSGDESQLTLRRRNLAPRPGSATRRAGAYRGGTLTR